jgi:hypothetical protein
MPCTDCQAARETRDHWHLYDSPKCLFCTARLIQTLGRLPVSKVEITARRRAALADALAWGHSESEIRRLAGLKDMAVEPLQAPATSPPGLGCQLSKP